MRTRFAIPLGTLLACCAIFAFLLPSRLALTHEETFSHDAAQYSGVAVQLLRTGRYSEDGVTSFFAREPGQSVFLAGVYGMFGTENRVAIFAVQGLIVLLAALFFSRRLTEVSSMRAGILFLVLFFAMPPVWHAIFSVYREALAIALALTCAGGFLALHRTKRLTWAAVSGAALGALILTYSPFLLFPFFLLAVALLLRVRWSAIAVLLVSAAAVVAPWAIRNYLHTGSPCFTGCHRAAMQWYVRGEQSELVTGLEPIKCLWAEYVSRDWTGRSPACSFNAVWHAKWPGGFKAVPENAVIAREAQQKILRNFGNYLWFSVFEVLELHLPYVNGWGRTYNLLSALGMVLVYFGTLLAVLLAPKRGWWLLLAAFIAYCTGVFALTDATPRYLLPILFCYVSLASVGYDRVLGKIAAVRGSR